jgi:excisionase family DNA binding protein
MATPAAEGGALLDVPGAAAYLGVSTAFVRRLVLEKRVRYYKVGKFVRFRPADLDAFVEAGRQDPVEVRVHPRSPFQRRPTQRSAQEVASRSASRGEPLRGRRAQRQKKADT